MRLLYLYVNDRRYFSPYEISFDRQFLFAYRSGENRLCFSLNTQESLPESFFGFRSQNSRVDDVSVVVGKNGAGKTSIARFLKKIREASPCEKIEFDYILVFETGDAAARTWHFQWFLEKDESEYRESKPLHLPCGDIPGGIRLENHNETHRAVIQDFEFVYYTPHLTVENAFGLGGEGMINLSPNAYLSGQHENENTLAKFATAERRRVLDFIRHIRRRQTEDGLNDFVFPEAVKIEINRITYGEQLQWLSSEIRRIREDVRFVELELPLETGNVDKGTREAIKRQLDLARQTRVAYKQLKYKYSDKARDFLLSAFAIYVLSVLKSSKCFSQNNYNPDAAYGYRLLDILFDSARMRNDSNIGELHRRMIDGLQCAIEDPRVPGTIVSSKSQIERRRRAVSVFRLLHEILTQNRDIVNHVEDSIEIRASWDMLYSFIDDYGWSIHVFDYLYITFSPVMAAGDMSYLTMYARMAGCIEAMDYARSIRDSRFSGAELDRLNRENPSTSSLSRDVVLFLDEAETTLHPLKQTRLLSNILWFCQTVCNGYRFHVVFSSHSPILLSDMPKSHAVFLSTNDDGSKVCVNQVQIADTFGANIFDLYRLPFFMDGTTGAFAQSKLDALTLKIRKAFCGEGCSEAVEQTFSDVDAQTIRLIGEERIRQYFDYWIAKLNVSRS